MITLALALARHLAVSAPIPPVLGPVITTRVLLVNEGCKRKSGRLTRLAFGVIAESLDYLLTSAVMVGVRHTVGAVLQV